MDQLAIDLAAAALVAGAADEAEGTRSPFSVVMFGLLCVIAFVAWRRYLRSGAKSVKRSG